MPSSESDSGEDSDVPVNKHVQRQSKKELKKALEQSCEDQASITKKIADQKAKNDKNLLKLCAVRNNHPALYVSIQIPLLLVGLI